jgi:FkbM family methyltransferase
MSVRQTVKRVLDGAPPIRRVVATSAHPTRRGERAAAIGRALRYEVNTTWRRRPTEIPLGKRSRIIAYPGETNSPHAVVANPPNWPEMLVWDQQLQPGDLFIDIGSNIGVYTIYALDLGAEVIAVEPVAHNAGRVREHLALNGYTAEVVEKALSDRPGMVRMTTDLDSYNHITAEGGVETEATTLDEILGDRTAAVKIDVEGAEALVLRGASVALAEHRVRVLQIEWAIGDWMAASSRDELRTILDAAGYAIHTADRRGELRPVEDWTPPAGTVNVFAVPTVRRS